MKKFHGLLYFPTAVLILTGCAHVPFEPVQLSSVDGLDVQQVLTDFKNKLPDHFSILESAVVKYRTREMTALGYSEVNEAENSLAVAGVSPVGVKIFEVKAAGEDLKYSFSFPQIKKNMDQNKIAGAVAENVHDIYFGRVPAPGAESFKSRGRIGYRQSSGKGMLEFFFGGPDSNLIEKRYSEGKRKIWRVRYFEYRKKDSKIYPSKIFFEQHQWKYKLTLRLKEILP